MEEAGGFPRTCCSMKYSSALVFSSLDTGIPSMHKRLGMRQTNKGRCRRRRVTWDRKSTFKQSFSTSKKHSIKRLRMREPCNDQVVCFQAVRTKLPYASYKRLHKPVSHGVLKAYTFFFGKARNRQVNQQDTQPRSQGLSSSYPLELQGAGRRETLGTRLQDTCT